MRPTHTAGGDADAGAGGWQGRVDALLVSLAKSRQCMTYADLAELASIPSPQRIHKLTQHLEARIASDAQRGVPIIASVVVSKRAAGLPGDGFFDCCAAHGISQQEGESAGAFHQRLLGQVFRGAGGGARSAGGAFADDEAGAGA